MKRKILMLSDHALSTSGVGCQSRFLMDGLLKKGAWSFRQFGAALQHQNHDLIKVSDDLVIRPIDGFGNRELILRSLVAERPDVLLLFTDPRFFIYIWEMHDEINEVCPIAYWHVWDNRPAPVFNKALYEGTDLVNCHSYLTYEMVNEICPGKANYIPHALPNELFFPISAEQKHTHRLRVIGPERADHFVLFWVNRNAKRKRPGDVLESWAKFINKAKETTGEKPKATLLLHTDPLDQEGPNLFVIAEMLGIVDSVVFSNQRVDFETMNIMHNVSDACINISFAEGFGLATLEAMQCGNPIIALKTGGLIRQVVDHRDGTENGVALPVELQTMVGSQLVPYIYEDYVSNETVANAIHQMYLWGPEKRKMVGTKAKDYVASEFNLDTTVNKWHDSLTELCDTWKSKKRWALETIV